MGFSLVNNYVGKEVLYMSIISSGVIWEMKKKKRYKVSSIVYIVPTQIIAIICFLFVRRETEFLNHDPICGFKCVFCTCMSVITKYFHIFQAFKLKQSQQIEAGWTKYQDALLTGAKFNPLYTDGKLQVTSI